MAERGRGVGLPLKAQSKADREDNERGNRSSVFKKALSDPTKDPNIRIKPKETEDQGVDPHKRIRGGIGNG